MGQHLLIGCQGGAGRWLLDVIGGGRGDRDVAELPGEVGRAQAAVLLDADAPILTQQGAQDCGRPSRVVMGNKNKMMYTIKKIKTNPSFIVKSLSFPCLPQPSACFSNINVPTDYCIMERV